MSFVIWSDKLLSSCLFFLTDPFSWTIFTYLHHPIYTFSLWYFSFIWMWAYFIPQYLDLSLSSFIFYCLLTYIIYYSLILLFIRDGWSSSNEVRNSDWSRRFTYLGSLCIYHWFQKKSNENQPSPRSSWNRSVGKITTSRT